MPNAGNIVKQFYAAVVKRDIPAASAYVDDNVVFQRAV